MHHQLTIYSTHPEAFEILVAELSELGFEGFVETGFELSSEFYEGHSVNSPNVESAKDSLNLPGSPSLQGFIPEELLDRSTTEDTLNRYKQMFALSWEYASVKNENWNALWESGFEPVEISGKIRIRALFHQPDTSFPMEIIIQPRMSFGTGHHATTTMICECLLEMDIKGKSILDFGTGTGILAILAMKLGASNVMAVDNDPQCVENAAENFELNDCFNIKLGLGDIINYKTHNTVPDLRNKEAAPQANASTNKSEVGHTAVTSSYTAKITTNSENISSTVFNIIIGNITRNVIQHYFPAIVDKMAPNGIFLCSGFYETDLETLKSEAYSLGLQLESYKVRDGWCAASFRKQ